MRTRSLQLRLALRLGLVYVLAIAVAMAFFIYQAYDAASSLNDRQLGLRATDLARYITVDGTGAPQLNLPPTLTAAYAVAAESDVFAIRTPDGRVIAASPPDFGDLVAGWPSATEQPSYLRMKNYGSKRQDYYGLSVLLPTAAGPVMVAVAHETDVNQLVHTMLRGFVFHIGWLIPIFLAATLAIGILAIRSGLQPLRRVSQMAAEIGPSSTAVRLPERDLPDEIVPLVVAVNRALGRLEKGFQVQREFTANAAHELRTPLAILTGALDTLESDTDVEKLKADAARMNRLVEQLLRVARLDAVELDVSDPVDLNTVAASVVAAMAPLVVAQERTIALNRADAPVVIRGNAHAIEDAIRNLVENALLHSPRGQEITVSVEVDGTVRVADRGPGVPAADREKIFQRFWRARDRTSGGSGLGLAIVVEIMTAHAGAITLGDNPGGGAVFTLRFGVVRAAA